MTCIIGTDEAGYGPNLGPLVIASTSWRVASSPGDDRWRRVWDFLAGQWTDTPAPLFGDSKSLYTSGGSWAGLERGLFAALATLPDKLGSVESWRTLLARLAPECLAEVDDQPWYAPFDCPLPRDVPAAAIDAARQELASTLANTGIQLTSIRVRVVFPAAFNARVDESDSKGTALSLWTLELVRDLMADADSEPVMVHCDKHGGRNRYAALLQTVFPESWIEVQDESRQRSLYRWGASPRRVEAQFAAKGERFLPSALASMAAKYVRELAMCAWNDYWQRQIPGLRPTAGYPVDARRFADEIRVTQQNLGIADNLIWRTR
jgi:ribonuclease HII